jgi:DNA-binding CsgD family transcriptional regulator
MLPKLTVRDNYIIDALLDPNQELKQIAFDLGFSYSYLRVILYRIYRKIGIGNLRQLILWAVTDRQKEKQREYLRLD